jgi:hypothetical protein
MTHKSCACCGELFEPRPQTPNQTYCSSPACQRARKRLWQREKLRRDPDYRDNQRDAQRAWHKRHPGYWRQYRHAHPEDMARNQDWQRKNFSDPLGSVAKMDVSPMAPGLYWIRPADAPRREGQAAWMVAIEPVCADCPCKKDACKERT